MDRWILSLLFLFVLSGNCAAQSSCDEAKQLYLRQRAEMNKIWKRQGFNKNTSVIELAGDEGLSASEGKRKGDLSIETAFTFQYIMQNNCGVPKYTDHF